MTTVLFEKAELFPMTIQHMYIIHNLGNLFFLFIKWNKQAKILRYSRPLSNDFNLAN